MQLAVKLRHALAEGYAAAENSLGQLAQTYSEAVRLYQLAADQGNVDAQSNLGYLYYDGRGVEQSYAEAARFFKLAADQGDGYAQYYLALLYENGRGGAAVLHRGGSPLQAGCGSGRCKCSVRSRAVRDRPGGGSVGCGSNKLVSSRRAARRSAGERSVAPPGRKLVRRFHL